MADRPTCTGTKRNGEPCTRPPLRGTDRCKAHPHSGVVTGVGRPTKLTPEVRSSFVDVLVIGGTRILACQKAGVAPATFYHWLEIAEADREQGNATPHTEFSDDIARAEADAHLLHVANIRRHVAGYKDSDGKFHAPDVRVSMWWLEKRGGPEYQQRQTVEHEGLLGAPKVAPLPDRTPEEQEHDAAVVAEVLASAKALEDVLRGEAPETANRADRADAGIDWDQVDPSGSSGQES